MANHRRALGFVAAALVTAVHTRAGGATPGPLPLSLVADVPLPGRPTRFDYQWVEKRRLYIAHLGDSALVVFDLDGQRPIQEVAQLPSVHGVVAAPGQHLVLATATAEGSLALIDDQTLQVRARVPAGQYPNGLAYDPASGRAFVSNNTGVGIAVVDVAASHALPGIDIGGGAGNSQYDAASGHVLAAIHGVSALADIDPATSAVVRIPLHEVSTCHGLVVSSVLRFAFAACRGTTARLVVVDLLARRQTTALPLPAGVDVLALDPGLRRLYAASETGWVAVFAVAQDRSIRELGRGFLASNAHSVAVDPATHRVYFPLENAGGHPVLRIMDPTMDDGWTG